jgi:fatty-acyl-CoA synthase
VLPHVEVSVRDSAGAPVTVGGTGHIFVCSPQVMAGYWGDDAAGTGDVLRDGCLDTGDIGYLMPDGFLHLTSRAREVIMVEGTGPVRGLDRTGPRRAPGRRPGVCRWSAGRANR